MEKQSDESETSVCRTFLSKLMSLQNDLHSEFHADLKLRDRLFNAVDLPSISYPIKIQDTSHRAPADQQSFQQTLDQSTDSRMGIRALRFT